MLQKNLDGIDYFRRFFFHRLAPAARSAGAVHFPRPELTTAVSPRATVWRIEGEEVGQLVIAAAAQFSDSSPAYKRRLLLVQQTNRTRNRGFQFVARPPARTHPVRGDGPTVRRVSNWPIWMSRSVAV